MPCALPSLLLDASGNLLGLGYLFLALLARLFQLFGHFLLGLREAALRLVAGIEALLDALLALIQHLQQGLVEEHSKDEQQKKKVDELRDERGQVEAERANVKKYGLHKVRFLRNLEHESDHKADH